jgi:hypothetical protein
MSWRPEGVAARHYVRGRPDVGDVVALERRAWEVTHVSDVDLTPEEQEALKGYTTPYSDRLLPYRVSLRRLHGAPHAAENSRGDVAFRVPALAYGQLPRYRDGRVPLCSCHGHPWPCLEADQQRQAEKELKAAEKILALLPGTCPGCGEVVTSRQKSITFGGPNVRNPLAEGPTFHLRRKCYSAAAEYENTWAVAEPGRKRSLLTLSCEGSLIVHGDGTAECYGAVDSDCPTVYARHRGLMACYLQSHGCGRQCSRHGHPGTRLAGRPDDPRAVTR